MPLGALVAQCHEADDDDEEDGGDDDLLVAEAGTAADANVVLVRLARNWKMKHKF